MENNENIILTDVIDDTLIFELIDYDKEITNEDIKKYLNYMENSMENYPEFYSKAILNVSFNGFKLGVKKQDNKCIFNKKQNINYQLLGQLKKTQEDVFSGYKLLRFIETLSNKKIKLIKEDLNKRATIDNIKGLEFKKTNIKDLLETMDFIMQNNIYSTYKKENSKIKRKN